MPWLAIEKSDNSTMEKIFIPIFVTPTAVAMSFSEFL